MESLTNCYKHSRAIIAGSSGGLVQVVSMRVFLDTTSIDDDQCSVNVRKYPMNVHMSTTYEYVEQLPAGCSDGLNKHEALFRGIS